jgi:hypothetical protein
MPFCDQNIGVLYAITATRIVGYTFFKTLLIQSGVSVTFFGHFLGALQEKETHTLI